MPSPELAPRPTDTQRRDEMMNQIVNGLFLMNGSGSAVLLAFLQAIWNQPDAPIESVAYGLGLMGVGTTLAGIVLLVRYSTTLAFARSSPFRWWWHYAYMTIAYASVGCFISSTLIVAWGVFAASQTME